VPNLEFLLGPRSVAVIGGSDRPASVGATVWSNVAPAPSAANGMPSTLRGGTLGDAPVLRRVATRSATCWLPEGVVSPRDSVRQYAAGVPAAGR
jgi:hypothetical protein